MEWINYSGLRKAIWSDATASREERADAEERLMQSVANELNLPLAQVMGMTNDELNAVARVQADKIWAKVIESATQTNQLAFLKDSALPNQGISE